MVKRTWLGKNYPKLIAFIILLIVTIFMMIPIVWGFIGSFRHHSDFTLFPEKFFPSNWSAFTLDGYRELFSKTTFEPSNANEWFPIWNWILNSFIVAIVGTLVSLLIASLASYAFVFLDFKYSNFLFTIIVISMTVPGIVTITPQLINMNILGVYKSLLGLIIPGFASVYGVFLIRQFFLGIPKDLVENARMDGASNFAVYRRVVLPLGKSVLFVQGLFGFMGAWNDVQWAQLIVGNAPRSTWTLAYGLRVISDNTETYEAITIALASAIIAMIPILIVYLFAQSKIIEGVAFTGLKGR